MIEKGLKTQDFALHGMPHVPLAHGRMLFMHEEVLLLPHVLLSPLYAPFSHGCGQKLPASCFSSKSGGQSLIFFS